MAENRQHFAARQAFALPEYVNDFNDLSEIDLEADPLERAVWREVEPFVNRPIVSLDAGEGGELEGQMWVAERLRFRIPNLKHVWLTAQNQVRGSAGLPFQYHYVLAFPFLLLGWEGWGGPHGEWFFWGLWWPIRRQYQQARSIPRGTSIGK